MGKERNLIVEQPDTRAVVDFIDRATCVELTVVGGTLQIRVKVMHSEVASTWDQHDFAIALNTGS